MEIVGTLATVGRGAAARSATAGEAAMFGLCFASGTIVQTTNGPKRIEDVKVGENVWSQDEQTGRRILAEVVETFVRVDQALVSVTIGYIDSQEIIRSTIEHPYWTMRGWVAARELTTMDQVLSRSGEWLPVVGIEESSQENTVYNFEVKGTHSYFVGKHGVLVHNASKADIMSTLFHGTDMARR